MKRMTALVLWLTVLSVLCVAAVSHAETVPITVTRLDPRFNELVPQDVQMEKIADGFTWVEGPAWDPQEKRLLFSDIPANAIYQWKEREGTTLYLKHSGYSGPEPFDGREPGSNGLTFDAHMRLVLCRHGDRQIGRLEADGRITPLVERYNGHRLNSPNDLVYRSNGDLLFYGSTIRSSEDL